MCFHSSWHHLFVKHIVGCVDVDRIFYVSGNLPEAPLKVFVNSDFIYVRYRSHTLNVKEEKKKKKTDINNELTNTVSEF